jgi:hypothetical protein
MMPKNLSIFKQQLMKMVLLIIVFIIPIMKGYSFTLHNSIGDSNVTSTRKAAIDFIDKVTILAPSKYWPNIKPALFLQNIKDNLNNSVSIYAGNGTNFCGYGALTYLLLQDDPLGYAKLMLQLYTNGNGAFGMTHFKPSMEVKNAAGALKYKGILDIHPADQMWFLSLADHFKGYLNFFNKKFDPDDEDTFWASVNYAKFNRMIRKLLLYKVKANGSDLIRPRIGNLYDDISDKLKNGTVLLFINNRIVHKKNHVMIKLGVPTHFIVVEKISKENNVITLIYWDYGGKTLIQVSPLFLKRITFGISYCTKIKKNAF